MGLFSAVVSLGVGTWLAVSLTEAQPQLVPVSLVGLSLLTAALLMGRANRELYEDALSAPLKRLVREPSDADHLAEYPSSLWVDAIGVTGVVLATPALAVLVVRMVEELSQSC